MPRYDLLVECRFEGVMSHPKQLALMTVMGNGRLNMFGPHRVDLCLGRRGGVKPALRNSPIA